MSTTRDQPAASVLLAMYNSAAFVRRTLLGLARQSRRDFDVIICDDGSNEESCAIVGAMRGALPFTTVHLRHEDRGFRKCRILNAGIRAAGADYLIFLDADCIPQRRFVEAHLAERAPGFYLAGRRVELGEQATAGLSDMAISAGRIDGVLPFLAPALRGDVRHFEEGIRLPSTARAALGGRRPLRLLGCNFSCWKRDLDAINGFNEVFEAPGGGEDTDIDRRFLLAGLRPKSVRHAAVCFHQYHPLAPRDRRTLDLCARLEREGRADCDLGLRGHETRGDPIVILYPSPPARAGGRQAEEGCVP